MINPPRIRLGTRGSALAQWQAHWTASRLTEAGVEVVIIPITTQGDVKSGSLAQFGGQGAFTKEIQFALLRGEIDLAVHSLKDLPTELVEGLTLAAVPPRESPRDVLVCAETQTGAADLDSLKKGAKVGTGSPRRVAQLLHHRRDLNLAEVRGNVDTRLRKLDEGQYDALVLAEAGLKRLGLEGRVTQVLPHSIMLPAVGQGALGLETRTDDEATIAAVSSLNDGATFAAVIAERAMLRELRAGCLAPVGAWGRISAGRLRLDGVALSNNGAQKLAVSAEGAVEDAETIGQEAAQKLLAAGAAELIAQAHDT